MFSDKELETTVDFIDKKKNDILNCTGGSDVEYLRDLQTLMELGNAAIQELQRIKNG